MYLALRAAGLPVCTVNAINESVGLTLIAGHREMTDDLVPVHHYRASSHLLLLASVGDIVVKVYNNIMNN